MKSLTPKSGGNSDERLVRTSLFVQLLRRPEAGVFLGILFTAGIFAVLPGAGSLYSLEGSMTFLTLAAELGILAATVALLIIAGEFDLSVGSMIGFAGTGDVRCGPGLDRRSQWRSWSVTLTD